MEIQKEQLRRGMRVKRPAWVKDESGRGVDPRKESPNLPDELIVYEWNWEDGESNLETPGGGPSIDYNTDDYPDTFDLVAPHDGDPLFKAGPGAVRDVGYDLKEQDPADCEMWAWGAPWLTRGADEDDGLWVLLTFCRPGFEGTPYDTDKRGEAIWDYNVFLVKGSEGDTDDAEDLAYDIPWSEAREVIIRLLGVAGLPVPGGAAAPKAKTKGAKSALETLNRHRQAIGMAPLDPKAAGWTDQDIVDEVDRLRTEGLIRANPSKGGPMSKAALKRLKNSLMPP